MLIKNNILGKVADEDIDNGTIVIPDDVTEIDSCAFEDCISLISIKIPDNVTKINYKAFKNCENLQSIKIPDGVKYIGSSAFCNCESLKSINIPDNITLIGVFAFKNCKNLKSIKIPNSVKHIGTGAFENCTKLPYHFENGFQRRSIFYKSMTICQLLCFPLFLKISVTFFKGTILLRMHTTQIMNQRHD